MLLTVSDMSEHSRHCPREGYKLHWTLRQAERLFIFNVLYYNAILNNSQEGMIMKNIIKTRRLELGLSQENLAKQLGVKRTTVS